MQLEGLSAAVVIEKKNQIEGSNAKPGDITVQQYHRGFASSAFDVTITPIAAKAERNCDGGGWCGSGGSSRQEAAEVS